MYLGTIFNLFFKFWPHRFKHFNTLTFENHPLLADLSLATKSITTDRQRRITDREKDNKRPSFCHTNVTLGGRGPIKILCLQNVLEI